MYGFAMSLERINVYMKNSKILGISSLLLASALLNCPGNASVKAATSNGFINEICSQNKSCLTDSYGKNSDWIELYNPGDTEIDISGYGLSDKKAEPLLWTFPAGTVIKPHDYLVVFASGNDSAGSELHTSFSLSKNGETLTLCTPDGNVVQEVSFPTLGEDTSYGCTPDASGNFEIMQVTPGKQNVVVVSAPTLSSASGFYSSNFSLSMTSSANTTIYYTLDGSNPITSDSAFTYNGPVNVEDRTNQNNIYANYDENGTNQAISLGTGYKKPTFQLDKATVVRAVAKSADGKYSDVISHTYFVTTGNLSQYKDMTVISIVTDPENLFDPDKGIYVTGNKYIAWKNSSAYNPNKSPWDTDNVTNYFSRGREWERTADISVFEKGSLSWEQGMGIRIKGASTRNTAQKSFNIYARSEYGASKIEDAILPDNYSIDGKLIDKYDSLSIRAVGEETRLRDGFAQRLLKDRTSLTTQNMKPCAVFLNGEYWGLYEITEKLSDYFVETNYNIDKKDVAMIKNGELEEGEQAELDSFINFVKSYSQKDLTNSADYKAVCDYIDIDTMIEHYAAGLYLGTFDWPNYNYGVWRNTGEQIDGNPYSDGKWRFISYDFDYTMGATYENFGGVEGYDYNSFRHMLGKSSGVPTSLFVKLLENPEFKAKFASVYCDYANDVFSSENVNRMIEHYKNNYTDQLANTQLRWWGFYGGTPSELLPYYRDQYATKTLGGIKTFFTQRTTSTINHMKEYLGYNGQMQTLELGVNGKGKIVFNSNIIEGSEKWSGKYLSDIPVTITAVPDENMVFTGWSGDIDKSETTITVTLSKAMSIKANFEEGGNKKGDVNSDGTFNVSDVVLLQKYLCGMTVTIDETSADMNSDGKINIADLCYIKEALIK